MLGEIVKANADHMDLFLLLSVVAFVIAAVFARPTPAPGRTSAWAATVGFIGGGLLALALMFLV